VTRYEVVIFDFGGVFTGSPFDAVVEWATAAGLDPTETLALVFGSYERDTDHPWHRAERGELALAEARELILTDSTRAGTALDLFEVMKSMGGSAGLRDEMVERVRDLRAEGYRTGMITNNIVEVRDFWRGMLPLDELFDVVIDSSEVGVRKPDARIYHLALEQLGSADPGRAIFLDDHPGNIAGAEACGIRGVLVTAAYVDAIAELDALLAASP
jgi:epoxide hydrolase-like predicted phosphatase